MEKIVTHAKLIYLILMTLLALPAAAAAPSATVEGVQMPVWVVREGHLRPLGVGVALKDKDQIRTGANSRVLLRLAEGSLVKLGENATFNLENTKQESIGSKLFSATLSVLKGAFRFTTQAASKFRGDRDIKVKFHTVTAGIRGTDIWGKVTPTQDLVALIEGKVTVTRGDDEPIIMQDPNSYYLALADAPAQAVQPIPAGQLEAWSLETEIIDGQGAARRGGKWKVNILEADNQKDALDAYRVLEENGYAAEVKPLKKGDAWSYRVRIANLPNKSEAEALAETLKTQLGFVAAAASKQ